MANFVLTDDNLFYNKRTGEIKSFDNAEDNKHFVFIVQGGHCGNGYFIPVPLTINAKSKEIATEIAKNIAKIKKRPGAILASIEVSKPEFLAVERIQNYDDYFTTKNVECLEDIYERRVVIPSSAKFAEREYEGKSKRIDRYDIRTANDYNEKYVLQRYFAPVCYGNNLVYHTHYNQMQVKEILLHYIEQNTFEYGVKKQDAYLLALYYEIFGENNKYDVKYSDGYLTYKDEYNEEAYIEVTNKLLPFLESSKQRFENERQIIGANDEVDHPATIESSKEKFNKRFKKYQQLLNNQKSSTM